MLPTPTKHATYSCLIYLVLPGVLHDLFVNDFIHDLEALDGLLLRDADVGLLQRHGAEATTKTNTKRTHTGSFWAVCRI